MPDAGGQAATLTSHGQPPACRGQRHRRSCVVSAWPATEAARSVERDATATECLRMANWDDVRRLVLALPETSETVSHGSLFGASATRGSSGSGRFAPPTSGRSATPHRADRSSARASSTSSPRRRCWPTTPGSSSRHRTSTASRPCSCASSRSHRRTSRRWSSKAWLAMAPPRLAKQYLEANPPPA